MRRLAILSSGMTAAMSKLASFSFAHYEIELVTAKVEGREGVRELSSGVEVPEVTASETPARTVPDGVDEAYNTFALR